MSILQGAANVTISGGTFTAVSNTGVNLSSSTDIVEVLHSRSATAGLLDAAERFDAPKCDAGTRVSMLREMKNFVQEGGPWSPPAMYWLHGPAGVGKSALAQSLALSLKDEGEHAASFFFSRTAPGRNDGNQLIVTLACQLALHIPPLRPLLARVVKENPFVLNATNAIKMQSLIVDPINQLYAMTLWNPWLWIRRLLGLKLHPRLILVDGLDECNDPRVQQDLIRCIGLAVRQLLLPFRFVVASRPESHILATFELDPIFEGPDGVALIAKNLGDDKDADEQITTFLLKEFAEIRRTHPIREFLPLPWPRPGQIAQLVAKSSKGFIYPTTVVRYIKMPHNRPDECLERILGLSAIPTNDKPYEPLDSLYRHIFQSVPDCNKEAVRNIFHFQVVPHNLSQFITPRLIERLFEYKPGHVQHILRDLLCLVSFTGETIKVLHASLPDFLLDCSRSGPLCIEAGDAHAALAALFPCVLGTIDLSRLPDSRYVGFLKHMMHANMSNTLLHRSLIDLNLMMGSRYMETTNICLINRGKEHRRGMSTVIESLRRDIPGIAVVAAYFLVLAITNVEQIDVEGEIAELKTRIIQEHPFAALLHAVRDELFPGMIPVLLKWSLSRQDEYVRHIFMLEVTPSQRQIREEIFELYLLMLSPFFGYIPEDESYSPTISHQSHADDQQLTKYSNDISCTLLRFLVQSSYDLPPGSLMLLAANRFGESHYSNGVRPDGLTFLAAELLWVSLAHGGYSASLINLLNTIQDHRPATDSDMEKFVRILAPSVIDYLKRIYSEAEVESQLEYWTLIHTRIRYNFES